MATAQTNTPNTAIMTEPPSTSIDEQQHLSSASSTVSQSPIQTSGSSEGGGADHDHSCTHYCNHGNENTAATPAVTRRQTNTTIRNPYKKQVPASPSIEEQCPNNRKRRQFIEKYRLQSVHHRQRAAAAAGRGNNDTSVVATSRSALEVLRMNQTWRQQWRRRQQQCQDDGTPDTGKDSGQVEVVVASRPRLFLFQRMMQHQMTSENGSMTTQQQQQQQQQQQHGVWELGTGITELSGEGGSGKTQICLGLCMTCALTPLLFPNNTNDESLSSSQSTMQGNSAHQSSYYTSIYVTMGGGIPQSKIATRLHQMLDHRLPNSTEEDVEDILSRIWLLSLKNEDDFIDFVEVHLPNILNNQSHGIKPSQQPQPSSPNNQYPTCEKIGFIAFDSIANFFRFSDPLFQGYQSSSSVYNQKSMFHQTRSAKLFQLSSALRRMSDVYDVPIVMTNQVTTSIPSDDGLLKQGQQPVVSVSMGGEQKKNVIQPALGLIWSNCVTTRFMLQRKDGLMGRISTGGDSDLSAAASENGQGRTVLQRVRKACVLQSVCTPEESEVWYFIDTGAVVAVS